MTKKVKVSSKNSVNENGQKRTTITIKSFDDSIYYISYANISDYEKMHSTAEYIAGIANQLKESYKQLELSQKDFEERDILLP